MKVSMTVSGDYGTVIRKEVKAYEYLYKPMIEFDKEEEL